MVYVGKYCRNIHLCRNILNILNTQCCVGDMCNTIVDNVRDC